MATIVEGILNPYDGVGIYVENIADMLDAIDRREVPFLAVLGWALEGDVTKGANSLAFPCTQQQHTWNNDSLISPIGNITTTAYASGAVTLTLGSGEARQFVVDEILVLVSGANRTHLRVTSVPAAGGGDVLGTEVLNGDAAHAVGTKVYGMGRPALRGEQYATTGRVVDPTQDTNFTEIFGGGTEGVVAISGTEQSTLAYGVTDRVLFELGKKLTELAIRLEIAAQYGLRNSAVPTANDQPASRMGGLDYFIRVATGGLVYDCNGEALGSRESTFRQALDDTWDRGGNPSVAMMNLYSRSQMSDLLQPFVRTERTERVAGVVVNSYEYTHGIINIMLNKWTIPSDCWMFQPEFIGCGPLSGNGRDRSFQVETLPKDGDYDRRVVLGEYTLECRNRTAAHALLHNLKTG